MITLERIRLVNWHNFEDTVIDIGNRCLLAGDNGSGKSTIIDAIQYAMAADLRKARFNAAAGDRKGGRDLIGYVRCKLGSDDTEYHRGDTVAHVMLEFSVTAGAAPPPSGAPADLTAPVPGSSAAAGRFAAGVCVEAYTDGKTTEHFWIGDSIFTAAVPVRAPQSSGGAPLVYRQFRDSLSGAQVVFYDSKRLYLRDFTNRLGVWRRYAEYNPYLEAFTRSVSFTPLVSVDRFVCDYILEDRPVEITTMKDNLESYKEADRQARGAVLRIEALKKMNLRAAEWRNYEGLILKQEYLKLRIERDLEEQKRQDKFRRLAEAEEKVSFLEKEIAALDRQRFEWEQERRETDASLAANETHILYLRIEERIGRLKKDLEEEEPKAERYRLLKSQCESLLGRPLKGKPDENMRLVEDEEQKSRTEKEESRRLKNEAVLALREALAELADLEKGILRYPEAPTALREALEKAGISAWFLADVAEIEDPAWADAVEGWLNTRRFALLVDSADFQRALEIYDRLPRTVAGAYLPNLEKMRDAEKRKGSLAELVGASSPYARIYLDYVLGNVMCADIQTLKKYSFAVTRECMTYGNFTASRIREEVYRRHYLGQAARKERREFLQAEAERLKRDRDAAEGREREAEIREDLFHRAARTLTELQFLLPSLGICEKLSADLLRSREELAAVDTRSFRELQEKREALALQIRNAETEINRLHESLGGVNRSAAVLGEELADLELSLKEKAEALRSFGEAHPLEIGECEAYAEKQIEKTSLRDLAGSYESTLKNFRSRTENLKKEYQNLAQAYDREFNALLSLDPAENDEADRIQKRLEISELPEYREKIARARQDAEKEFKEHFISRLNELIEDARESFREINDILRSLSFGRDQYHFTLEERSDRKGQIEIVRKAAAIPVQEESLFSQLTDPAELKAAQDLFERILNANLDSPELRSICDYRTYFRYDIKIKETDVLDQSTGRPMELSLSKVLREKSGGETQTPYYVAIAASFYRFYKARPESTVRLVMFDEAFNRMDDERIGKILKFYQDLNIQIISSVPTEKIEAIAPHMDRINLVIRHGFSARVRDFHSDENAAAKTIAAAPAAEKTGA
ncbi:MAG: AAA family ATPase [Spirochaetaceae bacterium]|jgi:energy-coupling factor transporter ATP-binding protein EcfA2|nr:AAA family ATPase [Spirochaetaceae bacterium]